VQILDQSPQPPGGQILAEALVRQLERLVAAGSAEEEGGEQGQRSFLRPLLENRQLRVELLQLGDRCDLGERRAAAAVLPHC
jgi:hypothetical protein